MNGLPLSNQEALDLMKDPKKFENYSHADFYIDNEIPGVGENVNLFRQFLKDQFMIKNKPNFPQLYTTNLNAFTQQLIRSQEQGQQRRQIQMMNQNIPIAIQQPIISRYQQSQVILKIEHYAINFDNLKDLTIQFIIKETQQVIKVPKNTKKFNLVPQISIQDELGEWNYDHLNGLMRIYLSMSDNTNLPEEFNFVFSEQQNCVIIQQQQQLQKENDNINTNQLSIKEFINNIAIEEQKDNNFSNAILRELAGQYLDSMKDLIDLKDEDWRTIQMHVQFKKLIRKYINQYKFNTSAQQQLQQLGPAYILAAEHRIRRFFIYKTQPSQLDHIEYINKKALEVGFQEISQIYKGESLLTQLEIFYEGYTAPLSHSKSITLSRGMLLYGPPGTGKTTLTDTLPQKIGLTPICNPMSAGELNRSYVGQSEKLIIDMVNRARYVPYLLCCVSIDEIDGLAPKRDERSGSHKIDALAVLLSVIGGINDVPNLIFVSSTNRINSMDDAFKRRMSGQYFVGRPSPKAREAIIDKSEGLNLDEQMKKQIIKVTSNFTGAALKQLLSYLIIKKYHRKQSEDKSPLAYSDIIKIATETSRQFNIKLGSLCLPELFYNQNLKSVLNLDFIKNQIENNIVISLWNTSFQILYPCKRTIMTENDFIDERVELFKIDVPFTQRMDTFQLFLEYVKSSLANDLNKIEIIPVIYGQYFSINQMFLKIQQKIKMALNKSESNKGISIICVWDDYIYELKKLDQQYSGQVPCNMKAFEAQLKQSKKYMFDYHQFQSSQQRTQNIYNIFYCNNQSFSEFHRESQWKNYKLFDQAEINYTGRILIDLNQERQCLQFQKSEKRNKYAFHNDPIRLDKRASSTYEVIPKLVEFATDRNIDFILLMDQDFLLSANAFDESKIMENISEKMSEYENYDKSLLIIDVDSMCGLTQSISNSSMGQSISYNLSDAKIYNLMLHYAKTKANILKTKEYWVALICNKPEMTQIIKKDLQWPQDKKDYEQEKMDLQNQEMRRCISCEEPYQESKNNDQKCQIHPGQLINISDQSHCWTKMNKDQATQYIIAFHNKKAQLQKQPNNPNFKEPPEPKLVYLCCLYEMNSNGCYRKDHTNNQEDHDRVIKKYLDKCEMNYTKAKLSVQQPIK